MRKRLFPLLLLSAFVTLSACQNEKAKNHEQEKELEELRQLAEFDRREMEQQYKDFAVRYDELKKSVSNDSLLTQLNTEQQRAEKLLAQLRATKKNDAATIRRLKIELESVRSVLRSYILQVDSLARENGRLTAERDEARTQLGDANSHITRLNEERTQLSAKIDIAAQLNASAINLSVQKKNGKLAKKTKDIRFFSVTFMLDRNVTAPTGNRQIYLRLLAPNGTLIGSEGQFTYENRSLEASATKQIEYTGEEQAVKIIVDGQNTFLAAGVYTAHLFCDKQMIGSATLTLEK